MGAGLEIGRKGEIKNVNKRIQTAALSFLLITASPGLTMARERLAHSYSSASGVFAGLWVAQEGKIFEKYDIDSHLILIASGSLMVQAMLGGALPIAGAAISQGLHGGGVPAVYGQGA